MKVQFNGPEAECTAYGNTFVQGEPTDVSGLSEAFQAKLANNPTFSAADDGDLNSLTVKKLKALAAERHVDLGDATTKGDIIAALELAAEDDD